MQKKIRTIAGDGFNSVVEQKPFQKTRENAKIHKSSRNFKLFATVVCAAVVALFTLYGKDHGSVTAIAKGEATITTPAGSCSASLWGDIYVGSVKPFSWWNCEYLDCDDYNVIGEVTDCNGEPIPDVRITGYLTGDEASTSVTAYTNSYGLYRLQVPAYSDVTITVKSDDYMGYSPEVSYTIKGKSAGNWVHKPFKLPCEICGWFADIGEYVWNGDTSVVINGVTWATRNVDAPGTFAATPESYGMFYQWNRKIGWSSTDPLVNSNGGTTWDDSTPSGTEWEKANDPSPAGWRVPTKDELYTLSDTAMVSSEMTSCNGVCGRVFTDKASGKSVFFPTVGYRNTGDGLQSGFYGFYWSSTYRSSNDAYDLRFDPNKIEKSDWTYVGWGFSVRCVPE